MVYNQLLWSIRSKVIVRLEESDIVPIRSKSFLEQYKQIVKHYENLKEFIGTYCRPAEPFVKSDDSYKGLYLYSFSVGVSTVLEELDDVLFKIEEAFLHNSGISVLQVLVEFEHMSNVLSALSLAVEKTEEEKYSGCKILDLCKCFMNSGAPDIEDVFTKIQGFCLKTFYNQTKQWLIHTTLHDPYGEYFIKATETSSSSSSTVNVSLAYTTVSSYSSRQHTTKYEVNAENLPSIIPFSIATKMLFIGEALIMCQLNEVTSGKKDQQVPYGISKQDITSEFSVLEESKQFDLRPFSNLINDFWARVNRYVCDISNEIGNVNSEIMLMWEFYLLGRGELFHEFLLKASSLLDCDVTTADSRKLNMTLRDSLYNVYLMENSDLIDRFYFNLPNRKALMKGYSIWSVLSLNCKVKWPLQYLFTPEVLKMYNTLFCFLIKLKKSQVDVSAVCKLVRTVKEHTFSMKLIEVQQHLLSVVYNLQNYCFTTVIASEMNILRNTVKDSVMFTDIQKGLLLFLTNISTRLFLPEVFPDVSGATVSGTDISETINKKVYRCFLKIFSLCKSFSELLSEEINDSRISKLSELKSKLHMVLKTMFLLLNRMDQHQYFNDSTEHLYNLMMCLDYNRYYAKKFDLDLSE